jgi:hypothetical protein
MAAWIAPTFASNLLARRDELWNAAWPPYLLLMWSVIRA